MDAFRHRRVDVGQVTLHVVEAGGAGTASDRPPVVLLHGFPEFWWSWRHQLAALATAGHHAVAPDLRGFNLSDRPPRVRDYRMSALRADLAGLIRSLGADRAVVVGHDWGGGVAWSFAEHHPEMVDRLVVMNCPHPARMRQGLRTARQLRRSWYMLFFQLPWLPEWAMRLRDFRALRRAFTRDGLAPADAEPYVEAARAAGGLGGGINYYRASARTLLAERFRRRRPSDETAPSRPIAAPTLIVWGQDDRMLLEELAHPDPRWVPDARVAFVPGASHWVQNDRPAEVNALLLDFLAR